jgi:hypothetical protein
VITSWWARLWGVSDTVATSTQLEQRVAALEEDLDYLRGELRRLRGRVTGGLRATQEAPGSTNGPPAGSGVSPATWARLDDAARERLLNRRNRAVPHG